MVTPSAIIVLSTISVIAIVSSFVFAAQSEAAGSATVTYTYDSLGRLAGEGYSNYTGANTLSYTYDKGGNRSGAQVQ